MNYYKLPDMSYYQYGWNQSITKIEKYVDFQKVRQRTRGVILRSSQGNWQDKAYKVSCANAKAAGLAIGNYHYFDIVRLYYPLNQATPAKYIHPLGCSSPTPQPVALGGIYYQSSGNSQSLILRLLR